MNNQHEPNNYQNNSQSYNQYTPNFQMFDPEEEKRKAEEERIRNIVKEEVEAAKPKRVWLRVIALILVGALLGTGAATAVLRNDRFADRSIETQATETQAERVQVDINLNEDSTVENAVATKAIPSIVGITAIVQGQQSFYFYEIPQYAEAVGSGVIVDPSGYILTNSHVVNNGNFEELTVSFSDNQEATAELVWNDQTLDLAIIKVEQDNLPAAELGDSDLVQVGDKAIAVGNPLGLQLQSTLTSGYVSGLDRTIKLEDANVMDGLIQTDAAINSGNSGGALLNAEGKVIGINTARPQAADGIGFAIPINITKPIIEKVITEGSFEPLYLGISGINVQLISSVNGEELPTNTGVLIQEVYSDSPAGKADLKSGDIITKIDDKSVDSMNSLKSHLLQYEYEDKAEITFFRGEEEMTTEIIFIEYDFPQIIS